MKRILLLLMLGLTSVVAHAQYGYSVEFQQQSVNGKELMGSLFPSLGSTYDLSILDNHITFTTTTDFDSTFVDSLLRLQGVMNPQITTFKGRSLDVEKANNQNCGSAQILCSNDAVYANSQSIGFQELNNSNHGCLSSNERQASWYYVNVQTGGSLVFRINPSDNDDDYDFAVWGPFTSVTADANCPPINDPIRCSYSGEDGYTGIGNGASDVSEGSGGDRWVSALTVSAGEIYIIYIDNYSASGDGYSLSFDWGNSNGSNQSTAVLGCMPVILPVGVSSFEGTTEANYNVLSWVTESETNNDYFTLEWSTTGNTTDWSPVQKIEGAGDSESPLTYHVVHDGFQRNAFNYYRLVQTDFNGNKSVLDKLVVVDNRLNEKPILKVMNLLGQEVDLNEKGVIIVVFEDGTQEKRFN